MEHWLHFIETFSAFIFRPEVMPEDETIGRLWGLLVRIIDHYCRPGFVSHSADGKELEEPIPKGTPESVIIGAKLLHDFASSMEASNFPSSSFTYNLHLAVCR